MLLEIMVERDWVVKISRDSTVEFQAPRTMLKPHIEVATAWFAYPNDGMQSKIQHSDYKKPSSSGSQW
jgi:hypothetical protein